MSTAIDEVRAILGPGGPLSRALPGYEDRPEQLRMAEAVARALEQDTTLLVEAGTGTGKTLAYLVPAILSGKKIVVSTGTRALQDQIIGKDLPLLAATTGLPVRAAVMKGLSNYVCLRRLDEALDAARAGASRELLAIARWARQGAPGAIEAETLGDRAELGEVADEDRVWADVTSSPETRIGAKCEHFDQCYVTKMRARAEEAQIVVVNHHLYFADLAARGGPFARRVLPEHDAVVFDEAHRIEDVATDFFGVRVGNRRLDALVGDTRRSLIAARALDPHGRGDSVMFLDAVTGRAAAFFAALPMSGDSVALGRETLADPTLTGAWHALDDALEGLAAHVRRVGAGSEPLAQAARRAHEIREDLAQIFDDRGTLMVRYAERRARSVTLAAAPIDLSGILRERLFFRAGAVVLTSATLAAGGDFRFLRQRLGIDFDVEEMVLGSPFDWVRQAALYTPASLPDPRDAAYLGAAAAEIEALVAMTGGGAFVLCTSLRMMRALHAALRDRLDVPTMIQGEQPKAMLVERFRAIGNAVLFATASFWEGIDVPGDALRLVVIDKLPFEVPSDPVVAARIAHLEEHGQNAFVAYQVPSAAITLKQGFGRLVRTRSDRGIVAILDRRLTARGYGKTLLRSLPPCARVTTLEEAREFWQRGAGTATIATTRA